MTRFPNGMALSKYDLVFRFSRHVNGTYPPSQNNGKVFAFASGKGYYGYKALKCPQRDERSSQRSLTADFGFCGCITRLITVQKE